MRGRTLSSGRSSTIHSSFSARSSSQGSSCCKAPSHRMVRRGSPWSCLGWPGSQRPGWGSFPRTRCSPLTRPQPSLGSIVGDLHPRLRPASPGVHGDLFESSSRGGLGLGPLREPLRVRRHGAVDNRRSARVDRGRDDSSPSTARAPGGRVRFGSVHGCPIRVSGWSIASLVPAREPVRFCRWIGSTPPTRTRVRPTCHCRGKSICRPGRSLRRRCWSNMRQCPRKGRTASVATSRSVAEPRP